MNLKRMMITPVTKIELSLPQLKELGITPNEYVWLYRFFHDKIQSNYDVDLKKLENDGFLKITEEGINLREKTIKMFEVGNEEARWQEFFLEFPMKVPARNGGTRPLRPANLEAKSNDKLKAKYLGIIKNKPELHIHILKCLSAEVEMRRRTSTLQFMNAMDVWMNQRIWEKYAYLISDKEENVATTGYGEKLI